MIAAVLVLGFIGVKLDMSHLRPAVEVAAGTALGRDVTINGPVSVEFSNWPELEVSDIKIANAANTTQPDFLNAGLARMRIGIYPLLRGHINIAEITAERVTLNLESDAQGNPNWVFDRPEKPIASESVQDHVEEKSIVFAALDQISLKEISINYHDAALDESLSFVLGSLEGTAPEDEPVSLNLAGRIQDKEYDLELRGGPLTGLLDSETPGLSKS
ncbi:MAG: AsmA family protein [Gammaproteobacteria bacterium]|nr:AsmA family protein [Gammaproteobacteria bacterium]